MFSIKKSFHIKLNQRQLSGFKSFHSSKVLNAGVDQITRLANFVEETLPPPTTKPKLDEILAAVWANERVTSVCPDLVIRLTSLRGQISRTIWQRRGGNPDDIQILAVGTVTIPDHLPKYHKFLTNFYRNSLDYSRNVHLKDHKYETGYDLFSKGSETSREAVLNLYNEHFGFEKPVIQSMTHNSAITCGGMRGLKDLADGLVLGAKDLNTFHRFIQPDNSFGTWWNIIEKPEKNDTFRREIHLIPTNPENKLHLSPDDVHEFYLKTVPTKSESWYITPVGNPSGTKMKPDQLTDTVKAIIKHNPNAVIILDSVYLRTLRKEDALKLMHGIVSNSNLLENIIFVESFSKSHGLCRERLGIYFSANEQLFTRLHAANIAFSAGPGVHKDYQFLALGNSSKEDREGVSSLHEFWMRERKGLFNYLSSEKFKDLFEEKQPHITSDDMEKPLGLYIVLKTKLGIKAQDVFMKTGALGVDTPLASGHYIRFSVGTLTKPYYSQFL